MSTGFDNISFDMPKTQSNAIKVIGVGGGGSNAVNHMFNKQINGVDFVICNTDAQALENSPIPNKVQLGADLTSGLGAGANPEVGAQAAAESIQEIQQMLTSQTKMVFITAGMGGGTGTGAAPIIAKIAKDLDILTVGIVTMPFLFEGKRRTEQAQKGVDELRENVDSLIVINNNKLREVYGNLGYKASFSKADEVLATAAKGIAEVITSHYTQNIDLHDAKTVLANSGTAIMGSAIESGENRAMHAIMKALDSPLLNDNKITGAKNVLLLIVSGTNEITMDEIAEINEYIQDEAGYHANIIMGVGDDESLGDGVAVTVVATGFTADQQGTITNTEVRKIVHTLEANQKATYSFKEPKIEVAPSINEPLEEKPVEEKKIVHFLEEEEIEEKEVVAVQPEIDLTETTSEIKEIDVVVENLFSNTLEEEDFVITDVTPQEEEVIEEPIQQESLFDLPLPKASETKEEEFLENEPIATNLGNSPKDVETTVASTTAIEQVEKRYVLDAFDVAPTIGKSSKPSIKNEVEEALQFEVKTKHQEQINNIETISEEVSPLSGTISELQRRRNHRLEKMKQFNHKFNDQVTKNVDELEKQPAYKRLGVSINTKETISDNKTALNNGKEDLLRSNNSFLHDNVD